MRALWAPFLVLSVGCGGTAETDAGGVDGGGFDAEARDAEPPRDVGANDVGPRRDAGVPEPGHDAGSPRCVETGRGCIDPEWVHVEPVASPPAREDHAMAYHAALGEVILFGGWGGDRALADTWAYDGATWRRLEPPAAPPARAHHTLVYDSSRGRVLLFGGASSDHEALGDTWAFDGSEWRDLAPATSPGPRSDHALAYDATRDRVLLTGGVATSGPPGGASWAFDGGDWEELPAPPEIGRRGHATEYDPARDRVVLFGYRYRCCVGRIPDAWEHDGDEWVAGVPGPDRQLTGSATLHYHPDLGGVLLVGPSDRGPLAVEVFETWLYDGTAWRWTASGDGPPVRGGHGAAHDVARGVLVVFGGQDGVTRGLLDDTWELRLP